MSLFDWYEPDPAEAATCPVCGCRLLTWQGQDGPCGLFVWRQGVSHPVDQRVDDESRISVADRKRLDLPKRFVIYSYDCPEHQPVEAQCSVQRGVWSNTQITVPKSQ